jgi:hypothetical protein
MTSRLPAGPDFHGVAGFANDLHCLRLESFSARQIGQGL